MDEPPPGPESLPDAWPLTGATEVRDAVLAAYGDPGRGYHDLHHLAEVLGRLEELSAHGTAFEPAPVLLAAWFHDAIYDGERDAEERSAVWAEDALAGHANPTVITETARLVRLTETHRPADDDPNGCALSDADLGILAAPHDRYQRYVTDVRREYAHLPDEVFASGRADVLRDLLAKPGLFHTAYGREHWERPARANMEAELERLSGSTAPAHLAHG